VPTNSVILDLHARWTARTEPPGAPFFVIKRIERNVTNRAGTMKIQAFHKPNSKAGMSDKYRLPSLVSAVVLLSLRTGKGVLGRIRQLLNAKKKRELGLMGK